MRLNFKRLGLLGGKAARACAKRAGLTSARLDLMVLLQRCDWSQADLARTLCVCPSVVSRMVTALEECGLVYRYVPSYDRRLRLVCITELGAARIGPCIGEAPLLSPRGSLSAQCAGEAAWLMAWKRALARVPIGSLFRSMAPPFGDFQWHNRHHRYDEVFARAALTA